MLRIYEYPLREEVGGKIFILKLVTPSCVCRCILEWERFSSSLSKYCPWGNESNKKAKKGSFCKISSFLCVFPSVHLIEQCFSNHYTG